MSNSYNYFCSTNVRIVANRNTSEIDTNTCPMTVNTFWCAKGFFVECVNVCYVIKFLLFARTHTCVPGLKIIAKCVR